MSRTISQILNEYTASWEQIEFIDPVTGELATVVPPYVMNTPKYINEDNRKNNKNWKRHDKTGYFYTLDELQTEFQETDGVEPGGSTRGKSRPEVIKGFLEREGKSLMNDGFLDYRKALVDLGIGVDCSGFVSRAIARVMNELNVDPKLRENTLGFSGKAYKSNTTTLCSFREGTNDLSSHTGLKLVAPMDVLPGDVLFNKDGNSFHIRIVTDLLAYEGPNCYFQTAEASAVEILRKVLKKTWKYNSDEDKLFWTFNDEPEEWHRVTEWNSTYAKSKFHLGRPLAFVDLAENYCSI